MTATEEPPLLSGEQLQGAAQRDENPNLLGLADPPRGVNRGTICRNVTSESTNHHSGKGEKA